MNTNLRSLKRTQKGFTVLRKAESSPNDLCSHCCMNGNCTYQKDIKKISEESNIQVNLSHCPHYIMPILFRDETGLNCDSFNTMRMGGAFSRRLKILDTIGLVNKKDEVINYAKVTDVLLLDKHTALTNHAKYNHMLIEQDLPHEEAAEKLAKILRNNYGNLVFTNNDQISILNVQIIRENSV